MTLKESAAADAARRLRTIFEQMETGRTSPDDVSAANVAMELAAVFGVTPADYARHLTKT
ncbi:hypothetical protein [Streptomyces sp. NPDC015125]|uniref:hypothetical protein n=1 Tax=Streptomyces sp. NPDC015125 TaxID=3364938 RepID=UPI0036F60DF0